MPKFLIESEGKRYEVEAPDENSALDAFADAMEQEQNAVVAPPAGLVPGSKEYATWAAEQARAGKRLPQVGEHTKGGTDLIDKLFAGAGSFIEGVPIAGPTLLDWAKQGRSAVHGMSREAVDSEFAAAKEANPISSGIGNVAGTIAPLAAMGTLPVVGRLLGAAGGLPSQIGFGAASSAAISGLDAKARGASDADALGQAALGGVIGAGAPLLFKGAGAVWNKALERDVSKEARHLSRALGDDQIPVAEIPSRLAALGDDAMVMDLGPNLQRQAGALASVPGAAQKTVRHRLAARGKRAHVRVADDVAKTVGSSGDIDALKSQIIAAQSAAADPLYAAIRDLPMPSGGNFTLVFSTPMGREALEAGMRMAANDGVRVSENGFTLGMIDYAKRALDDIAKAAARRGEDNVARQASDLARVLRAEADKLVPEYAQARAAYAGPAQVLDAIDEGYKAFGKDMSPAQLKSMLSRMSASEQDAYLQGARASIESMMGNAVNDVASLRNLLKKGWNEAKLRALLGDDIADDLLKRVERELTFGNTANIVSGNSETAARQLAQQEVAPGLRSVRPEGFIGLLFRAFDAARAALRAKTQPKVNARLAAALSSGSLDAEMLGQLQRAPTQGRGGILPPAAPATLLTGPNDRRPVEITVGGRGLPTF